uniref:Uncharacterized protein n=1 Tax=Nelumbo nucifera TaxID=4432 RepID=A0A822XFN8_NELNU|nr:TPA_asm: hypothetical protein HUJ06_020490 [Nelumbo nucifera]
MLILEWLILGLLAILYDILSFCAVENVRFALDFSSFDGW